MFRCECQKSPTMMPTDCSVRCTPTILPSIRISWDYHPTFMLISGRVPRAFIHLWASSCGFRPFDPGIMFKLSFAFLLCLYYTLYQQNFLLHMQLFPSERSKCSKTRKQPRYGVYIFFLCKRTIFEVYKRCWSTKRKKLSDDIEQCAK